MLLRGRGDHALVLLLILPAVFRMTARLAVWKMPLEDGMRAYVRGSSTAPTYIEARFFRRAQSGIGALLHAAGMPRLFPDCGGPVTDA